MPTDRQLLDAYRDAVIQLVQAISTGELAFVPPEDGDWLRGALEDCADIEPNAERATKIRKALWPPIEYAVTYGCPSCAIVWRDTHTCACDDDCPRCGVSCSPQDARRI